jgi:type 1 glutamine amidotransferase
MGAFVLGADEKSAVERAKELQAMKVEAPGPRSRAEVEGIMKKAPRSEAPLKALSILLVAGPKDHGAGEHDYPKWQKDWAPLMSKAENVKISTAFGWPQTSQWEGVDVAVFYMKGKWDTGQIADVKKLQDRGGGVVSIHWGIGCDQPQSREKHAERFGLSFPNASYRHGHTELKLTNGEHPVVVGMPKVMHFVDEPYWPFIGDKKKVDVIAISEEMVERGDDRKNNPGSEKIESIPVFWAYEPTDSKGRAFVTIFGHYMWTFDDPYFRLMLLRGIAWSAKDANVYRLDGLAVDGVEMK